MCHLTGAASMPRSSEGGLHGLGHAGIKVLDCSYADRGRPQQLEKDLILSFSLHNTLFTPQLELCAMSFLCAGFYFQT